MIMISSKFIHYTCTILRVTYCHVLYLDVSYNALIYSMHHVAIIIVQWQRRITVIKFLFVHILQVRVEILS